MATTVVVASRNAHKIKEIRRILATADLDIDLIGTDRFPDLPDVDETGSTFAANALIKAREVAAFTGLPAIADDSGLCVAALNEMPGVLSARWCGHHGDDEANLQLVLGQMSHVPSDRRGASFRCAAAIALPSGEERVVEGALHGSLATSPRGVNGFGYDPVFVPVGQGRTTAEMTPAEKDAISHRGVAFAALVPVLRELLESAH